MVGSLPRPRWVQEVVEDRREGRLDPDAAAALLDAAVPLAVRLQERAGLDVVSDGEWRRESYVKVFSENVDGFAAGESQTRIPGAPPDMVVVAPLVQLRPIAAREVAFLRTLRDGPVIVALPSPYILAWRTWSAERSRARVRDTRGVHGGVHPDPARRAARARRARASSTCRSTSRGS